MPGHQIEAGYATGAMESLLRWFMDGDSIEDKEDSLASFSQLLLA